VPNPILEVGERDKRCGSTPLPSTFYFTIIKYVVLSTERMGTASL